MSTLDSKNALKAGPEKAVRRIRWVLAHEPIALFEPAAREFARLVEEGTNGELRVDILSLSDYAPGKKLNIGHMPEELRSGRLDMAQVSVQDFGILHKPMWAVDAPFLFTSHEHATRVLDGEIGRGLLSALKPHGLRGLAFTYSGGFRVLAAAPGSKLEKLEDLRGLRVRTTHTPVAKLTMEALGATAYPAPISEAPALARAGLIDAAETTWARYWSQRQNEAQPVVVETGHSLLITSVVMNEKAFQSLPAAHRAVVEKAAAVIAVQEREHSVREGDKARAAALAEGVQVSSFVPAEQLRFRDAAMSAYAKIEPLVGKDILEAIRKA